MDPFAAYADFVEGSLRLMVHYAHRLACRRDPSVPMDEALDRRVDILRKTVHYDGRHPALADLDPPNAAWDALKAQLAARIAAHAAATDTAALEDECWDILRPLVEPRLREDFAGALPFGRGPYGCWHYDIGTATPDAVNLHFSNAYQPASPFAADQRPRLVATLRELLHVVRKTHADITTVRCGSWLNRLPPFLALFPPAWATHFAVRPYSGGTGGYWGQYMDRRGALHRRNAAALRATGAHPFAAGICHCPIADAIGHIDSLAV